METVPGTYLNEFRYLLERVPSTDWKEFQVSTGKISSDRMETVPVIYWQQFQKEFQVFI